MLLCLKIDVNGDWTESYYGDFGLVKAAARYSARDNKHMVPVNSLLNCEIWICAAGSLAGRGNCIEQR